MIRYIFLSLICSVSLTTAMDSDHATAAPLSLQELALEQLLIQLYTNQITISDLKPGGKKGLPQDQFDRFMDLKIENRDQADFLAVMILRGQLDPNNVDGKGRQLAQMIDKKYMHRLNTLLKDASYIAKLVADGTVAWRSLYKRVSGTMSSHIISVLENLLGQAVVRNDLFVIKNILATKALSASVLSSALALSIKGANADIVRQIVNAGAKITPEIIQQVNTSIEDEERKLHELTQQGQSAADQRNYARMTLENFRNIKEIVENPQR